MWKLEVWKFGLGSETCWLKVKVTTNEDKRMPPATAWQHRVARCNVGDDNFESDPTLVCSSKLTSVCSDVFVELRGVAKKEHPECAGRYLPVKGKHNRGRWVSVYRHHLFRSKFPPNLHFLHDKHCQHKWHQMFAGVAEHLVQGGEISASANWRDHLGDQWHHRWEERQDSISLCRQYVSRPILQQNQQEVGPNKLAIC